MAKNKQYKKDYDKRPNNSVWSQFRNIINNTDSSDYGKKTKLRLVLILFSIALIIIFIFGIAFSAYKVNQPSRSASKSVNSTATASSNHAKKILNKKPKIPKNSKSNQNQGFDYAFELKIKPIRNKNVPELPSSEFNSLYARFTKDAIAFNWADILDSMDKLSKKYNFTTGNNQLLVGFYDDAKTLKTAEQFSDSDKIIGRYLKKHIIMPQSWAGLNLYSTYKVSEQYIVDPNSLTFAVGKTSNMDQLKQKYQYVNTIRHMDTNDNSYYYSGKTKITPLPDIQNKYGTNLSSVYEVIFDTTSHGLTKDIKTKLHTFIVELKNGNTIYYGTYYDSNIGEDIDNQEDRSLKYFANDKELKEIYKNAQENQGKANNNESW
ncbi:hypothetical protein EFL77_08495 [Pediococcus pentosaceus]|uniref:hypothetical protein n=1 Tax=Pediococcus pentosaceus TaxID=1255 RepID=UPI00223C2DBB|nr:hypothetical protein [Pediococcus pentosaceus]MCT1178534.1 hypothetical protein [Pediococcus pentosaceus]